MDIKDIMTTDPMCIEQDATIGAAISVMVEKKIRDLPVVDPSGAVVGVITDRDLRSAALAPALEQYLSDAARRRLRGVGAALENSSCGEHSPRFRSRPSRCGGWRATSGPAHFRWTS